MRISINPVLFSHGRGGLEGVRPSSSREHQILAEVQISTSAPTASRRNRNFPFRYRPPPSAKRSGGRQALQLPRASNSCGSSNIHLRSDCVPQKSEFPVSVPPSSIREEVWRESGPPAPSTIIPSRKFCIPPPLRPRPAEIGISRFGTVLLHPRRGQEGDRPSSSPEYQILAEVPHFAPILTAHCGSRNNVPAEDL